MTKDLQWLADTIQKGIPIKVVIDGHVDECTDWIKLLLYQARQNTKYRAALEQYADERNWLSDALISLPDLRWKSGYKFAQEILKEY